MTFMRNCSNPEVNHRQSRWLAQTYKGTGTGNHISDIDYFKVGGHFGANFTYPEYD